MQNDKRLESPEDVQRYKHKFYANHGFYPGEAPREPDDITDCARDAAPKTEKKYWTRDEAIAEIRAALKRRSGKVWSVTGGRGTAWGWITIDAPPARRTWSYRLKEGAKNTWSESYEGYESGHPGGVMTPDDQAELAKLLGLESVHSQGVSIRSSSDDYQEHVDRANGRTPSVIAEPYWD